jgi:hypothetical protein
MNKLTHLILAVAVALGLCDAGLAQETPPTPSGRADTEIEAVTNAVLAQETSPSLIPLPGGPDAGIGGGVLQALPRPRDFPASLYTPPPPSRVDASGVLRIDAPYFERDPLLDPPMFPAPGWFGGAEMVVLKPHLVGQMGNNVLNRASGIPTTVVLGSAPLDWTVSPRFFAGYRLPSGFGEFMVSYRFLSTVGTQGASPTSTALNSRLAFNIVDLDYNSRELSLFPQWDMKWTFGMRLMNLFFASQTTRPITTPSGTFDAATFNNIFGIGPHSAVELSRHLGDSGWSFYNRIDLADLYDNIQAGWLDKTYGPNGQALPGETRAFGHQGTTILNVRTGLNWQDSPSGRIKLFLGYQLEYFWALNRLNPSGPTAFTVSHGDLWTQGIFMQAAYNY